MPKAFKKRNVASMEENVQEMMMIVEVSRQELGSFFSNLQSLYRNQQFCDITFKLGNIEFKAHKVVIAASGNFLSGLLMSGMRESESTVITIGDAPHLFKFILDYLYGFSMEVPSSEIVPLLGLANSYSMISLRDSLSRVLIANLSIANCCALFAAAGK